MSSVEKLPVHGCVLAGGKSSRMGEDKALLHFRGSPMVEVAVEKLRTFCTAVSIVGNRNDLSSYAPVVPEARLDCGPAAGVEAGLMASALDWAMFLPVDVPLVPAELLRRWMQSVLKQEPVGCGASFLLVEKQRQPTFCAVRRAGLGAISLALELGQRRLADVLYAVEEADLGWLWTCDAAQFAVPANPSKRDMEFWFSNINTPQELAEAAVWAASYEKPQ